MRPSHCTPTTRFLAFLTLVGVGLLIGRHAGADPPSYLANTPTAAFDITASGFTVECWVKVRSLPGYDPRLIRVQGPEHQEHCNGTPGDLWELLVCNRSCTTGTILFEVDQDGVCHVVKSTATVNDGSPHHIAATYDGITMRVYVDGILSGSTAATGLSASVGGGRFVVGTSTCLDNPFDGQIDDIRIWSVARSAAEIAANQGGEIPPQPNLVANWQLDGQFTDSAGGPDLCPAGDVSFTEGGAGGSPAVDILETRSSFTHQCDFVPCTWVPPIASPADVTASSDLRCEVEVSWSPVPEATGYRVYRDGAPIAVVGPDTTHYRTVARAGSRLLCVSALSGSSESLPACAGGTSVDPPAFHDLNGNYYEPVPAPYLSWTDARIAAETYSFRGFQGHLATVADVDENTFIADLGGADHWLGGYQTDNSGPNDASWTWVVEGEPWQFTSWANGEPNEDHPGEDYLEMMDAGGGWNDVRYDDPNLGYIVEYDVREPVAAPVDFNGTGVPRGVNLYWSDVVGAVAYGLSRDSAPLAEVPQGTMSYIDEPEAGEHLYCIHAINPCGCLTAEVCRTVVKPPSVIAGGGLGGSLGPFRDSVDGRLQFRSYFRRGNPTSMVIHMGPRSGLAELVVYDLRGAVVRTLFSGWLPSGAEKGIAWDATDSRGGAVPPGVYFIRLVLPGATQSGHTIVLP